MEMKKRIGNPLLYVIAIVAMTFIASIDPAQARSSFFTTWDNMYPNSQSDDVLINATGRNCQLCHESSSGGGTWNGYGWDMKVWLDSGLTIDQAITAIESTNSDLDSAGSTNLEEINAGSQPGWTIGDNLIYDKNGGSFLVPPPAGVAPLDPVTEVFPDIAITPASVQFGAVTVGNSVTVNVNIANAGDADLDVNTVVLSGSADFSIPLLPTVFPWVTLAPGQSVDLPVTYTPSDVASDSGSLAITSNDPDEPTVTVPLSGNGIAPTLDCTISVLPLALNFGDVIVGNSATLTTTVSNSGSADCVVDALTLAGSTDFSLGNISLPLIIAPGMSADVPVVYTPSATGSDSGSLDVSNNDPDQPLITVSLSGNGVAPAVVDYDIAGFRTTKRVNINRVKPISIKLVVKNAGGIIGNADAVVVGIQNGVEVYSMSMPVVMPEGANRLVMQFPDYTPSIAGDIMWTATVNDADPDIDQATATTRVVQ